MQPTLRKWRAVFGIYFQDGLAYRASGLIWILTDITTAVTMPLVFASATAASGRRIAGYSAGDFVVYYLCMLLLGSFITSHIMWELAMEIKEGQFSTALLRPMSFYQITFLRNISWRVIRMSLFAPMFVVLLYLYRGYLGEAHVHLTWEFWLAFLFGHLVSFNFVYMMSLLALFLQEAQAVFELYYIPMLFLSGQLFPISLLPPWAKAINYFFPFYFTTGAPTEILVGRVTGDEAHRVLAIQLAWIVGSYALGRFFWRHGLKHYTGVGM